MPFSNSLKLVAFAVALSISAESQVLISSSLDSLKHPSAMLQVKSENKGFLPPVMGTSERKGIQNPAEGLMVYDTTRQRLYVYTRSGWRPLTMDKDTSILGEAVSVEVTDLNAGDYLGVALASQGSLLIAGASGDDIGEKVDQGSAYIFKLVNDEWTLVQKVTAPDGKAGDVFGMAAAINGKFAMVGAPQHDLVGGADQGAVYVYRIQSDTLEYFQKMAGTGSASGDQFGYSIALTDSQIVVGAPFDDIASNADQGSAYFFEYSGSNWVQTQKVFSASGANRDYFGGGLSLDGNFASIGCLFNTGSPYGQSQNAVYLYKKINGEWVESKKIPQPDGLSMEEGFGISTALAHGQLVIGAVFHDNPIGNKDRGASYHYSLQNSDWILKNKISPYDSVPGDVYGDYFGVAHSLNDNYMVIGAHHEDWVSSGIDKGGAYLYQLDSGSMRLLNKIGSPLAEQYSYFGGAVSQTTGWIIISAYRAENGKGKIFFFPFN